MKYAAITVMFLFSVVVPQVAQVPRDGTIVIPSIELESLGQAHRSKVYLSQDTKSNNVLLVEVFAEKAKRLPVPGMTVELVGVGSSSTDEDGAAFFYGFRESVYTVEVYAGKHLVYRRDLQLRQGANRAVAVLQ